MMIKNTILSLFMLSVLATNCLHAQNLPTIIPSSPEAANFTRYGEIPISLSTGVPDISVPLFTVKSRKLELPLSISYHASGIQVNQISSPIGLGWVLNAGGLISRSINSKPDGSFPKAAYQNSAELNAARTAAQQQGIPWFQDYGTFLDMQYRDKDWQSDRYYYQLPTGESGVFYFDYSDGHVIRATYGPEKIEVLNSNLDGFVIVSKDGTRYSFAASEKGSAGAYAGYNTSWLLTEIKSADATDHIRLVYKEGQNRHANHTVTSVLDYGLETANEGAHFVQSNTVYFSNVINNGDAYSKILDSIITVSTKIKVHALGDRQDMKSGTGKYRITKIEVYDRLSADLIKSFTFNQSYFGAAVRNNQRLKLDGISVAGNNSQAVENYYFKYEVTHELPPFQADRINTTEGLFSEDYWGYYNGTHTLSGVPSAFVPAEVAALPSSPARPIRLDYSTNRLPDANYVKSWIIKEIRYPTGGKTEFEFEPNYSNNGYTHNYPPYATYAGQVGGLRIRQIKDYSADNTIQGVKTYEYDPGITKPIASTLYSYGQRKFVHIPDIAGNLFRSSYERIIQTSNACLPLTANNGPLVMYPKVTEYFGDPAVTEYMGPGLTTIGKTVHTFEVPPFTIPSEEGGGRLTHPNQFDRGNYVPRLLTKTNYKNVGGNYIPVDSLVNSYISFFSPNLGNTGMHIVLTTDGSGFTDYAAYDFRTIAYTTVDFPNYFRVSDTEATEEVTVLTQSKTYTVSNDGTPSLENSMSYTYGNLNLQPTAQSIINSKGETLRTEFKYPSDFGASFTTLINANILTPVIEQKQFKGNQFLKSTKTNYNLYYPSSVETKVGQDSPEVRLRFHSYDDKGNVLSVSKENDVKTSYIWGYDKSYPIAEVGNAEVKDIFYTSFEETGGSVDGFSKTGLKLCTQPYTYSLTNLTNGNYKLSYWKRTGGIWNLISSDVSVTSNLYQINITNVDQTTPIDEVRFHPINAQMTTYTYAPLVGVTSVNDANNIIAYYSYDAFGRLSVIKDHNGNILKTHTYNYKK